MSKKDQNQLQRRTFLTGAGALVAGTAIPALAKREALHADIRHPGAGPSELGMRSLHEPIKRTPFAGTVSMTPLQALHGTITPADLHFERHHGGIPALDPETHELFIHGLVDKPIAFKLSDLLRMPAVTRICFVECSGNYFPVFGENSTPQTFCGLTSQSEWTGVSLSTLLNQAGIKKEASWLLAEGGDAPLLSRSIPVAKALDDALIVYAQNGEAIRPSQGYPFRLLLPGWEGNTSVK